MCVTLTVHHHHRLCSRARTRTRRKSAATGAGTSTRRSATTPPATRRRAAAGNTGEGAAAERGGAPPSAAGGAAPAAISATPFPFFNHACAHLFDPLKTLEKNVQCKATNLASRQYNSSVSSHTGRRGYNPYRDRILSAIPNSICPRNSRLHTCYALFRLLSAVQLIHLLHIHD